METTLEQGDKKRMKDAWKTGSPTVYGGFEPSWAKPVLISAIRSAGGRMRWGHGGRDTRLHLLSPGTAEQALCPSPRGQSQAEIPLPRTTEGPGSLTCCHPGHGAGHAGMEQDTQAPGESQHPLTCPKCSQWQQLQAKHMNKDPKQ